MSEHDNGNVSTPEPGTALVGPPTAGLPVGAGLLPGGLGASVADQRGTDVLKGGMDRSGLFHALRRRWLMATSLGLLAAAAIGATLFVLFPEQNSAVAQYRVSSAPVQLLDGGQATGTTNFEIFKNTQVAYIRSPLVAIAALRDPQIANLPMFDDADDKVEWLRENITATFPSKGEILEVSMAGPYPQKDLKAVVEAVSRAYYEEVVFRDQAERTEPLQILKKSSQRLGDLVRDKLEFYQKLAKESGTSAAYAGTFDPETKLMLSEVAQLIQKKAELEGQLLEAATKFQIFEQQINDPSYQEQMVDQMLQSDPMIAQMQQQIMYLDMQIRGLSATVKNGRSASVRRLEVQMAQYQQELAQMKEQMRSQLAGEQSNEPNPYLKTATTEFTIRRQSMQSRIAQMNSAIEEIKAALLLKAENNTDLMLRLAEIEQLRDVQQGVARQIQSLQVEIEAPNRVQAIGTNAMGAAIAETSEDRNRLMRFVISGLGGLGALGLTCFGIGLMEFRNRRLNGPDQVDEGLGIRVIGTLPSLSGKKALNPKSPVVAQLNESIDSVRTALMHESTSKKRQLVLVTSPETGEGRTTVASQLAASLARAGRRTLLIDGDVRRPALHSLFNSPLEDGLCEVLRAEAEVTDVIRPTQAEGLWLMTAGYCDADAVRALATDQVQPLMDKLRADYDFIIIDGAPVVGLSDSLLFGQHCDGAILSVLRDRSCVTRVHQSAEQLRSVGVRLIGAVVNGVSSRADNRVTHLQKVTLKSEQKKLAAAEA